MEDSILKADEAIKKTLEFKCTESRSCNITGYFTPWFVDKVHRLKRAHYLSNERMHDYNFYVLETGPFIMNYTNGLKVPLKIVFGTKTRITGVPRAQLNSFQSTISRLYISDDPPRRLDNCLTTCQNAVREESTLDYVAPQYAIDYSDSMRSTLTHKTGNEKRNHFINCFNQYQGISKSIVPSEVFEKIQKELIKYGLTTAAQISREHIRLILKDLGMNKMCSDNLSHIYFEITGRQTDVSHLKEKILQDFDVFNNLYKKRNPAPDKKPFNYQQLLFQFLRRHGHPCNPDDFNFLKTTERKIQHNQIYESLFQELGWNYTSLL